MAMYSAYFDDSGHPDSGRYLVVAGAVADVDQWVHFEREWLEALRPLDLSVFHATDFEERTPPYDRLSDVERSDLLLKLASIICRRVERTISRAIDLRQYNACNEKYVFAESYAYPFPLCARSCIGRVEAWAVKHSIPRHTVKYFFESGSKHRDQLKWIAVRDDFTEPAFVGKRCAAVQAGDLLAWSHNLHLTTKVVPPLYATVLNRLGQASSDWSRLDMPDPDRLP